MTTLRITLSLYLVLESLLVGYCSRKQREQVDAPYSSYCGSYCNSDGYYVSQYSCNQPWYCCGNSTKRYCCTNATLDISNVYPDVWSCSCPKSYCSTPIWEIVIYTLAAVVFIALILFVYGRCRKKDMCRKLCKKTTDNTTPGNGIAAASSMESITTLSDAVGRNASLHMDREFSSTMQPPSYETVTRDLPKYEDIFNEASGGYDGPFEMAENAAELSTPPSECEVVAAPRSECPNNDASPPHETPL